MPRYFFNVHDGRAIRDSNGTELAGLDEARVAAVRFAGSILNESASHSWKDHVWHMEVANESGAVLLRFDFSARMSFPR